MGYDLVNLKKLIGAKIKKRRLEVGFSSQAKLAEAVGIDQSRVSLWESGAHKPDPGFRAKLAEVLDVDVSFFEEIEAPEARSARADSIIEITGLLSRLDERELRTILAAIRATPSLRGKAPKSEVG